jgi:Fic family protein
MGSYEARIWIPTRKERGVLHSDLAQGDYSVYVPDSMEAYPSHFSGELMDHLNESSVHVAKVDAAAKHSGVANLDLLLSRTESLASSYIEGHTITPQQLLEAEVVGTDDADVQAVMHNATMMTSAMSEMVNAEVITADHIMDLQHMLLPDLTRGYRTVQNWIGSSNSPITAAHVPPAPESVEQHMDDLLTFMNRRKGNPIANAALAHAQFESIHPFVDGNGRTGRALIHVMLRRAGLIENTVLPISTPLSQQKRNYINGLHSVRTDGAPESNSIEVWIDTLSYAADDAADRALWLVNQTVTLRKRWDERIAAYREANGMRALRSDSVVNEIVAALPGKPCMTAESVATDFGVSHTAAATALNELQDMGVLESSRDYSTRSNCYTAPEIVAFMVQLQRRVITAVESVKLPTMPKVIPYQEPKGAICGKYMPIAKSNCHRRPKHFGQCRS